MTKQESTPHQNGIDMDLPLTPGRIQPCIEVWTESDSFVQLPSAVLDQLQVGNIMPEVTVPVEMSADMRARSLAQTLGKLAATHPDFRFSTVYVDAQKATATEKASFIASKALGKHRKELGVPYVVFGQDEALTSEAHARLNRLLAQARELDMPTVLLTRALIHRPKLTDITTQSIKALRYRYGMDAHRPLDARIPEDIVNYLQTPANARAY